MKTLDLEKQLLIIGILFITLLTGMMFYVGSQFNTRLRTIDSTLLQINNEIKEKQHADSLRINHYATCSFISRDDIGVGFDGYLYSKNHRKHKIIQH